MYLAARRVLAPPPARPEAGHGADGGHGGGGELAGLGAEEPRVAVLVAGAGTRVLPHVPVTVLHQVSLRVDGRRVQTCPGKIFHDEKYLRLNLKVKVQSRTREEAVVLVAARRESEAEAVAESLLGAGCGAAGEGGDGAHVPHGGAVVLVASPLLRVAPATTLVNM